MIIMISLKHKRAAPEAWEAIEKNTYGHKR